MDHAFRILKGHSDEIMAFECTPDGKLVSRIWKDRTLRIWDVSTGKCLRTIVTHRASGLKFAADGRLVSLSVLDDSIKFWDLTDGTCINTLASKAWCIQPLSNGNLIMGGLSGAHETDFVS